MKERVAAIGEWLEHRTGIIGGIQHFLYEEIPASSGWHQVFGSVALVPLHGAGFHRYHAGV